MSVLKGGYYVTAVCLQHDLPYLLCVVATLVKLQWAHLSQLGALLGFLLIARVLLNVSDAPAAWLHFAGCGLLGMATSYVFIGSTQYYTDYAYAPV
eukprot:15934-Eustigmatos_ZCMA.PRE.1